MSRRSTALPPPALTTEMTIMQVRSIPVATLRLHFDQLHLLHGGNKDAITKRLFDHLQAGHKSDTNDSNGDRASSSVSEDETSASDPDHSNPSDPDGSDPQRPLTATQQQAVEATIKQLLTKKERRSK